MKKITLIIFGLLLSFNTYAQLPLESFETPWVGTPAHPVNWTVINEEGPAFTWVQSAAGSTLQPANTGSHAAYLTRESATPTPRDWLITPYFNMPASGQLRFFSRLVQTGDQGGIYKVKISTNPDPTILASYTDLQTWTETSLNPLQTTYFEKIITLPAITGSVHIAFVMEGNDCDRWLVDDVKVVSQCLSPITLSVTSTGLDNAVLNWINQGGATSWNVEVVLSSQSPTGNGDVYVGQPPYTKSGLLPDTEYKYYIRAICSDGGESIPVGPFFFNTAAPGESCSAPIIIPSTLPFTDTDNTASFTDFYEGIPGTGCNATGNFLSGNDVVYQYTPTISGNIHISITNNGVGSGLFIYDNCSDIGVSCLAGGTGNATTPVVIPSFAATAGNTYYIVISTSTAAATTPYTLSLQQVYCASPTGLTSSDSNATSAKLTWATGTATSWQLAVQPANTGLPTGAGQDVTQNTALSVNQTTAGDLFTPATNYEYWVRANCGNGTYSIWSGPYYFSTTQIPATLNYVQDFESTSHGWSLNNASQPNKWSVGAATNNGGTKSLYISNDNSITNAYTININNVVQAYRDIQIPANVNQLNLSFDYKGIGDTADYFRIWLVPTSYIPIAGTQITAAADRMQIGGNFTNTPAWLSHNAVINAAAYSGQIRRLVFEWRNDAFGGSQPPAAIDNINLSVITCSAPTAPVIAANSLTDSQVTINWTAPTSAVPGYDYYLSSNPTVPTGATTPTNTSAIANPTTTITTLTPSNSYYFWVRSNCGPGDASTWTGPLSFVAPQVPAAMNYTQNFDIGAHGWALNNGTQTNKWAVGSATSNSTPNSLYISEDNGITNTYNVNAQSVVQAYRDIQMPAGLNQLLLSFDWKNVGENNNDYFRVWIVPAAFVPTPGTQITAAADRIQVGGNFTQNGSWSNQTSIINAAAFSNSIRRLVFEWRNNTTIGTQAPAAIDNINLSVITCIAPTAPVIATNSLTNNQVIINWTPPTTAVPGYDYYLSSNPTAPTGATAPTNTAAINTPTVTITTLTPSNSYYFWVRSNCGAGDTSIWTGPLSFVAPQVPAAMDYIQNFDLGAHGWALNNGTQTNKWAVGTATSNSASSSLYISEDNGVTNTYNINALSVVQAYRDIQMPATLDQLLLSFDWKNVGENNTDYFRVWIVPAAFVPTPGTQITAAADRIQIGGNFMQSGTWTTQTNVINAAALNNSIRRLVFEWRNSAATGTQGPAAIDNISLKVITCPQPSNIVLSGLVPGVATFTWTATTVPPGSYDYYVTTDGTPPTAATSPTGNTLVPTVAVNGLPPSTNHNIWVRSNCSGTDKSFWIGPLNFTTPQVPATMNYTQNFDLGAHGWDLINGTQTNKWVVGSATSNSVANSLYVSNDNGVTNAYTNTAVSVVQAYRDIQLPATLDQLLLTFDWKGVGDAADYFRIWMVPINYSPTPGTQITAGTGRVQIGGNFTNSNSWLTSNTIIPSATYGGQIRRLIFEWRNDTFGGTNPPAAIDNISLSVVTCVAPTNLLMPTLTATSATFTWTPPASAPPSYEYYYSLSGTPPTAGTTPTDVVLTPTAVLNGLPDSSNFFFWVRSNCGPTDKSLWLGPFEFSTPQIASPLNYSQNFDGPTYGLTIVNGNQTNRWVVGSAVNNSPSKSLYVTNDGGINNNYSTGVASVVHAYKDVTIPAGAAELDFSFDWKNLGETPNWDVIRVWRVPQNFVPTTGVQIGAGAGREQIGGEFVGNGNWTTANYILNSTGYQGTTVRFVFEWRNDNTLGTGSGGAIDNIDLSVITCPKPTTLTVAAVGQTGATFNWTEVGTATAWEVYVVPAGSPAPTSTSTGVAAPAKPFVYTTPALNPSTNYVYYVRSVCSPSDKSKWSGPTAFKTKIANDDCTGAYTLGVNAQGDDCLVSLMTSYDGATASPQPFECAASNGSDIWYQFVATEDRHNVELSSFTGEPNPVVIALYEGDQCGSLLQLNCSVTNVLIGQNLIPGNTYKVRLILNKIAPVLTTEFKICINTPEPPAGENQSACTVTTINYGFENPVPLAVSPYPQMINQNTVQGWRTTAADDVMEFWPTPNYENVNAYEGSQFIELNANLVSGIYQDYPTPQSTAFNYSFAHRGRQGTDTCKLLAGPPGGPYVDVTTATTTNTAWALYTGSYTTPANQPITRFIFQSVSSVGGVSVGNWLDAIEFTANNSVLSVSLSQLNCIDNTTIVTAAGSGEWSANNDNPGETVIDNPSSNIATISGFTANGIYKFDWTTQYCKSTIEVTYDNGSVAVPVVIATVEYCINETAVPLTATPLADHTLQWYTAPTGGTASTTTPTPDTTVEGVVTYYVSQLSDANCESPRTPIEVTVHELPLAPVTTATFEYCQNTTPAPLTADALAGHTLNWYTVPTGGTASATAPIVNTAVPGVTTYYVSQTSGQTCEGERASITITVKPSILPVTNFTLIGTICKADANPVATLNAGSTTGGDYSAETGLIIDTVTGEVDLATSVAGTYLVTYTVDPDLAVCNIGNSSSVSITVTPLVAAVTAFSYTTPVCTSSANQTPVLAAGFTSGGTFTSSDAGLVIDTATGAINIAASAIGSYTINYDVPESVANCTAAGNGSATIVITQTITPVTDFDFDDSFCFGVASATPNLAANFVTGGTFTGSTGLVVDPVTGQVNIAGSTSGTHTVTYTVIEDPANCNTGNSSKSTFTINGKIDFSLDGKCNGSAFIITAAPADGSFITSDVTYEWATASGTAVGLNSENFDVSDYVNSTSENEEFPLEFTLTVISNGCKITKSYLVEDIACAIQKGISPNGDGLNDNFDLKFMGVKKLSIFNRYGQDVYTKGNYKDEWYGQSSNGNELPTGTYYYVIERSAGGTTTGWIYINRQE